MPIKRQTARDEAKRLSSLPFFNGLTNAAFTDLVGVLEALADGPEHASKAISACLRGGCVPTPETLEDAINETRAVREATVYPGGCCGRYSEKYRLRDGSPAQCENGWIRHTVWREMKNLVDEQGNPVAVPYDFAGRCACQPGGTIKL